MWNAEANPRDPTFLSAAMTPDTDAYAEVS